MRSTTHSSMSPPYWPSKPKIRKWPNLLGKFASAILFSIGRKHSVGCFAFIIMIGRPAMLEQRQLVILLLRLAVAASLASILVRFGAFQRMLMREDRTLMQRLELALSCAAIYAAGVGTRVLIPTYTAVDLGLEGSMLAGMIGGYVSGLLAG